MSNIDGLATFVALDSMPRMMLIPADEQPQIAEHVGAPCTKAWSGYFKYEPSEGTSNMTIEVGADDNAYLQIDQFPDTPVNVVPLPDDPNGGGTYRTNSRTYENAPAGFYHVTISYVNVGGVAVNLSQLTVKVNGEDMVIGTLKEANLLKKADAQTLMDCYNKYNYINMPEHPPFWNEIKGTAGAAFGPNGASCAARVSQALCEYGVTFTPEPDLINGGFMEYKNKQGKIVYVRAVSIHNYMSDNLGTPMFTSKTAFDAMLMELANKGYDLTIAENKPIIVWSEFVGRYGHVGMGYNNEGSAIQGTFSDAENIWVLYRPDYVEPDKSII